MSMTPVGRVEALAALHESYAAAVAGGARVAVVSGPIMSGKSSLVRGFADTIAAGDGRVLAAIGSTGERDVPMGVLGQLLQSAGKRVEFGTGPDQALPDHRVVDECCALLTDVVDGGPALLLVDDVQYADEASLHALLYLLRRIGTARLLVVLSAADPGAPPAAALIAELGRLMPVRSVRLGMLDAAGLAALFGDPADGAHIAAVYALTGGNPVLAEALRTDTPDGGVPRPAEAYKVAVLTCLYRGGEAMLEAARSLALLDATSSRHLMPELAGAAAADVCRAVGELTVAGLIDEDGDFRHPMIREVALATLTPAQRGRAHRRIASLLHCSGADPALVAVHLEAALAAGADSDGADPDGAEPDWPAQVLVEAADFALRENRPADTVRYAEAALRGTVPDTLRAAAVRLVVDAQWRLRPSAAASHVGDLQAAMRAGHLRADGFGLLLSTLVWNGRFTETLEAMRSITGDEPTAVTEPVLSWLRFVSPAAVADRADAAAPATAGHLYHRAVGALGAALSNGDPERVGADADYVLQNGEMGGIAVEPLMSTLLALIFTDRLEQAESWCLRLEEQFAQCGQITLHAVLLSAAAEVALRRGNMPLARTRAARALTLISAKSWGIAIGYPLATHVRASTALGLLDEAAELLRRPTHPDLYCTAFALPYLHARAEHAQATNRPYAALEDFRTCGRLMAEWNLDVPTVVPWRNGAGQAYLALGKPRDAKALFEKQLVRARGRAPAVQAVALRLVAQTGLVKDRWQLLQDSVKLLQNSGHLLELTVSLAELSNEHYARGDSERARTTGRRAIEVAACCDAVGVARQMLLSGDRFDLTGLVDEADEYSHPQLTDAESRVARLAAEGLTNREIGRKLFLSMSTVEQRLTRAFRKLGVTRRTDLIGLAHTAAPASGPRRSADLARAAGE
jgi:DNA-binding CsgD family transcriptional regulator